MIKQEFRCKHLSYTASQLQLSRIQLEKEISLSIRRFIFEIGKMPKIDRAITIDNKFFCIRVLDEDFLEPTD